MKMNYFKKKDKNSYEIQQDIIEIDYFYTVHY